MTELARLYRATYGLLFNALKPELQARILAAKDNPNNTDVFVTSFVKDICKIAEDVVDGIVKKAQVDVDILPSP